jgi:hypothetical protein
MGQYEVDGRIVRFKNASPASKGPTFPACFNHPVCLRCSPARASPPEFREADWFPMLVWGCVQYHYCVRPRMLFLMLTQVALAP